MFLQKIENRKSKNQKVIETKKFSFQTKIHFVLANSVFGNKINEYLAIMKT